MGKLTLTEHLKACAEAAKSFTNGLVAELAQTVTEAMQEMENVKADKQASVSITIPTTGWGVDETSESYPNYCDITVEGVTAKDRADIAIAPNSMDVAIECGMCPTNETLAGIPSIIYGLVGMLVFAQTMGFKTCLLSGSLTLVVMNLPTIMRTTQEALKTVPASYREAAVGLGATKWYTIRTIVLPCTLDGVVAGAILAIGRIVGESAALLFTAGTGYVLVTNYFEALQTSGGTLSVMLYVYVSENGNFDVGFAIAAILMILVLAVNFATRLAKKKLKRIG